MRKFLSILLLTISSLIFSQESKESNWVLKLNATQLIDFFTFPNVEISVERKITPYFSINAEAGYQLYDLYKFEEVVLKPKGFKANLEGRLYVNKLLSSYPESEEDHLFFAIQAFYRENQNTEVIDYSPKDDDTIIYTEHFGYKRTAKGFNIIAGTQFSVSNKIIIEPYGGLGLLNRKLKSVNLNYDESIYEIVGEELTPFYKELKMEKSTGNFFNICFGVRIGYRL